MLETMQLVAWLFRADSCQYADVDVVDVTPTSTAEQRSTDWMTFQSLSDFLDPDDADKTIEGYPAPKRVIVRALAPASQIDEGPGDVRGLRRQ